MRRYLFLMAFIVLLLGCKQDESKLRIGIIKPSIDHLPLSFAFSQEMIDRSDYSLIEFTSGWELQEAMISRNIDFGILPFTYAYNAASRGYPLKIVSFFERETDGIVADSTISSMEDLNHKKIGTLRASSIEVLLDDYIQQNSLDFQIVYFRTPNEMIAALKNRDVSAIVIYVPLIQKLAPEFKVIHWFSESYPKHPCCDLVINTLSLTTPRKQKFQTLIPVLESAIKEVNRRSQAVMEFACTSYGLNQAQAHEALNHTVFSIGLEREGRDFEQQMMEHFIKSGYQDRRVYPKVIYSDQFK
ncbi:MAG: transporter substrate-binding domain-containing protein [Candidatus Cloacimonetes bacterium]|nr:transporter substrate-binding domain-containing protein [Candidatus Cloacimonadota bacterium]